MAFIDRFQTYKGDKPPTGGFYVNMEKERIEDWTHRSLKAEEPNPLSISFKSLGSNPEAAFERWTKSLTAESGGGTLR